MSTILSSLRLRTLFYLGALSFLPSIAVALTGDECGYGESLPDPAWVGHPRACNISSVKSGLAA